MKKLFLLIAVLCFASGVWAQKSVKEEINDKAAALQTAENDLKTKAVWSNDFPANFAYEVFKNNNRAFDYIAPDVQRIESVLEKESVPSQSTLITLKEMIRVDREILRGENKIYHFHVIIADKDNKYYPLAAAYNAAAKDYVDFLGGRILILAEKIQKIESGN